MNNLQIIINYYYYIYYYHTQPQPVFAYYALHGKALGMKKTLSHRCTGKHKELLLIKLLRVVKLTVGSCADLGHELYEKIH